jgi:hypothetical protein
MAPPPPPPRRGATWSRPGCPTSAASPSPLLEITRRIGSTHAVGSGPWKTVPRSETGASICLLVGKGGKPLVAPSRNLDRVELNPRLIRRCQFNHPRDGDGDATAATLSATARLGAPRPYLRTHGKQGLQAAPAQPGPPRHHRRGAKPGRAVPPVRRRRHDDEPPVPHEGQHRARLGRAGILLVHTAIWPSLQQESPIWIQDSSF